MDLPTIQQVSMSQLRDVKRAIAMEGLPIENSKDPADRRLLERYRQANAFINSAMESLQQNGWPAL